MLGGYRMNNKIFRDLILTVFILLVAFVSSLFLHTVFDMYYLVPSFFALSVFLISFLTHGYIYGIISAFVSVLADNYAFTFPYFEINFMISENLVSAIIMLVITIITSTLTTQIKTQEKIRAQAKKEKMRADLLRAVSHDLRTPLTAIYGASSTVVDNYGMLSDEKKIDMLKGIKEDAQWLIRMVENLLSVTRIDAGDVKLVKSSVVLEELIDYVLGKFSRRYPEQEVKISLPDEFVTISADPILIEQVLINLLENAVEHAVGMTELRINVIIDEGNVVFEVIDNGCGVSKDKLKDIFSGSSTILDDRKHGMGIGLSVCRAIINAHGGDIKAIKKSKDSGMIFRFNLEIEGIDNE